PARQVRIALGMPFPIPEKPPPEGGLTDADPVLTPESADRRPGGAEGLKPVKAALPVLQSDDGPLQCPRGQRRLAAKAGGEGADQLHEPIRGPQLDSLGYLP